MTHPDGAGNRLVLDEAEGFIRANARRLSNDAKLLFDNGRFASCALLQFFALEELGKIYLRRLGETTQGNGYHIRKQQGALALAAGTKAAAFLRQKLPELGVPLLRPVGAEQLSDNELIQSVANGRLSEWLADGGSAEFMASLGDAFRHAHAAGAGVIEYLRRCAAYVDVPHKKPGYVQIPVSVSDFGKSWTSEAQELFLDADAALDDEPAFAVACTLDPGASRNISIDAARPQRPTAAGAAQTRPT